MPKATSPLILASGSPRRREILERLRIPFEVVVANVDETPIAHETAKTLVLRLAKKKAAAIAAQHPGRWVLAADTTVAYRDHVLGKPKNEKDAQRMLTQLSGKRHEVLTGVCVRRDNDVFSFCDTTEVQFRSVTPAMIRWYVRTGEPMDKAGAYAIQGTGAFLIQRITGSMTNVVGLPVEKLVTLLLKLKIIAFT
jgi:septum formation protein